MLKSTFIRMNDAACVALRVFYWVGFGGSGGFMSLAPAIKKAVFMTAFFDCGYWINY